jgi:hypothetical protein
MVGLAALVGRFVGAFARDFAAGLAAARFGAAFLVDAAFFALFARALPAGERLVAGFKRVDFATRFCATADFDDERAVEREDSLFSGLPMVTTTNF